MSTSHTIVTDPDPIFGRLTLDSIPYEDPIIMTVFVVVAIGSIGLIGAVLYFGKLKYLWDEWFTSVDHKKIGISFYQPFSSIQHVIREFLDRYKFFFQFLQSLHQVVSSF